MLFVRTFRNRILLRVEHLSILYLCFRADHKCLVFTDHNCGCASSIDHINPVHYIDVLCVFLKQMRHMNALISLKISTSFTFRTAGWRCLPFTKVSLQSTSRTFGDCSAGKVTIRIEEPDSQPFNGTCPSSFLGCVQARRNTSGSWWTWFSYGSSCWQCCVAHSLASNGYIYQKFPHPSLRFNPNTRTMEEADSLVRTAEWRKCW